MTGVGANRFQSKMRVVDRYLPRLVQNPISLHTEKVCGPMREQLKVVKVILTLQTDRSRKHAWRLWETLNDISNGPDELLLMAHWGIPPYGYNLGEFLSFFLPF